MKTSAIIRIVIFSLVIVLLSFILMSVLDYNYYIESGRVHSYEEVGQMPTESLMQINQHDISTQIRNIEIEWVAGSSQSSKATVSAASSLRNTVPLIRSIKR